MKTGDDDDPDGGRPRGAQPHTKERLHTKDATGDPPAAPPGKRYLLWEETSKYKWLQSALDELCELQTSLQSALDRHEEVKERSQALPSPGSAWAGRAQGRAQGRWEETIIDRREKIIALKRGILDGCRPEPWPMPGDSGTPTESLPGTP